MLDYYDRWYRITCCSGDDWNVKTVVREHIFGYRAARSICRQLQAEYDAKHPEKITAWTKDLYGVELESEQRTLFGREVRFLCDDMD